MVDCQQVRKYPRRQPKEYTVGGSSLLSQEGAFRPRKGGGAMNKLSFTEVIALLSLIVEVIELVSDLTKKK